MALSSQSPKPRTGSSSPSYPRSLALGISLSAIVVSAAACMGAAPAPYEPPTHPRSQPAMTDPTPDIAAPSATIATSGAPAPLPAPTPSPAGGHSLPIHTGK
jgi:hypothetical protein